MWYRKLPYSITPYTITPYSITPYSLIHIYFLSFRPTVELNTRWSAVESVSTLK